MLLLNKVEQPDQIIEIFSKFVNDFSQSQWSKIEVLFGNLKFYSKDEINHFRVALSITMLSWNKAI